MANIQKRDTAKGTKFQVLIRLKGYPPQSATFERLTDARKWAATTEAAIREGRYFKVPESKRRTLGEAIDRYVRDVLPRKKQSSQYSQGIQLDWWKERMGGKTLADITPAVIVEARDELLKGETYRHTPRSASTVIRYMAVLSHLFTVCVREWEWLDDSPMRRVSKPKEARGRTRFLSQEERTRLLDACRESRNEALYPYVVLLLSTGMRKMEALSLRWGDVDLNRQIVVILESKNDQPRVVPLTGHALELLRERSRFRRVDTDLVFPAPYRHGKAAKPVDLQSAWDWAVNRAKLTDFRLHDCRHSAASYLLESGATLGQLAEILGHKTLQMVKRYSHLSQSCATELVSKMNAAIFAKPEGKAE